MRDAIRVHALSDHELARLSGVGRSNLTRFRNGGSHLSLPSLDKLGLALGLRLVATGRRPAPRRPPAGQGPEAPAPADG